VLAINEDCTNETGDTTEIGTIHSNQERTITVHSTSVDLSFLPWLP